MEIIKADSLESALRMLAEGMRPAAGCTNILVDYRKKATLSFTMPISAPFPSFRAFAKGTGKRKSVQ